MCEFAKNLPYLLQLTHLGTIFESHEIDVVSDSYFLRKPNYQTISFAYDSLETFRLYHF